ncbi:protein translocase subunit SecF [Candidatus Uhrbacteria bacterium]|nr:protein translocase subunit SecF [Candidatus Uhrbacteria bacterium]
MQIVSRRKIWYGISGIFVAVAIVFLGAWGLRPGIDFTGGALLEVEFEAGLPQNSELRALFSELKLPPAQLQPSSVNSVVFRFAPISEAEHQILIVSLKDRYGQVDEVRFDSIGPAVGAELFKKSLVAILAVTLMVLLYLTWAFRKVARPVPAWVYGGVAVVTFLHDTIIPLGVFSWLGKFYGVEIGAPFIAAVLMILAYSINDTIVVLDRVRENLPRMRAAFSEVIEASVRQSITRSINTSLTTVLVLVAVYLFGGVTLKVFSLALIIGIALGTYSSIFIAASLLVTWYRWKSRR